MASWFLSPVLSGVISICLFLIVRTLVLRRPEPLEPGLRSLPFFYGFTILINVFSVVHDGPSRECVLEKLVQPQGWATTPLLAHQLPARSRH